MGKGRRTTGDRVYDLDRLKKALEEPRTIRYLESRFCVSRATIHRWLKELEDLGVGLKRLDVSRPTKYQLEVKK